jgi:hypothetical protein
MIMKSQLSVPSSYSRFRGTREDFVFQFSKRALLAAIWIGWSVVGAAAAPPAETLLPASTKGFVTMPNVDQLIEGWHKTELGRLLDDPVMKPFSDDLRRQLKEKWARSHAKLGLSLDDLDGLASGALSIAAVMPSKGRASLVMLVDVAGREAKAQQTIEKLAAELIKQGAKRSKREHRGTALTCWKRSRKVRTRNRSTQFISSRMDCS